MLTAYDRLRRIIARQSEGGRLDLSVPDLARSARCSDRTVQRVLLALREEGDLVLARVARQHYPAEYDLSGRLTADPVLGAVVPPQRARSEATPEVTSAVPSRTTSEVTSKGGYGGYAPKRACARPPRPRRRRPLRADGTNPRAEAARRLERARPPSAFTTCTAHGIERNGLCLCRGCRADELAGTPLAMTG